MGWHPCSRVRGVVWGAESDLESLSALCTWLQQTDMCCHISDRCHLSPHTLQAAAGSVLTHYMLAGGDYGIAGAEKVGGVGARALLQQLLEQPLDAAGQAAPVQAVPDAHMYETLLVRPTAMTRLVLAQPSKLCHAHHTGLRAPQTCFVAAALDMAGG